MALQTCNSVFLFLSLPIPSLQGHGVLGSTGCCFHIPLSHIPDLALHPQDTHSDVTMVHNCQHKDNALFYLVRLFLSFASQSPVALDSPFHSFALSHPSNCYLSDLGMDILDNLSDIKDSSSYYIFSDFSSVGSIILQDIAAARSHYILLVMWLYVLSLQTITPTTGLFTPFWFRQTSIRPSSTPTFFQKHLAQVHLTFPICLDHKTIGINPRRVPPPLLGYLTF